MAVVWGPLDAGRGLWTPWLHLGDLTTQDVSEVVVLDVSHFADPPSLLQHPHNLGLQVHRQHLFRSLKYSHGTKVGSGYVEVQGEGLH